MEREGAIAAHVEAHLGEIDFVWHEIVADRFLLEILHVPPARGRAWHTFVTSGMSTFAIPGTAPPAYMELIVSLPATWPVGEAAFRRDLCFWPIRWLKTVACFPHERQRKLEPWSFFDAEEPLSERNPFRGW